MRDFNHTVGVLVKAYLEGTLEHTNCFACAVGNIVADSIGMKYCRRANHWHELQWSDTRVDAHWYEVMTQHNDDRRGFEQIHATGYTLSEITAIERAFEYADFDGSIDKWEFNGLMAVVDVLADIHGIDLTQKEEAKALFVKA